MLASEADVVVCGSSEKPIEMDIVLVVTGSGETDTVSTASWLSANTCGPALHMSFDSYNRKTRLIHMYAEHW